MNTRNPIWRILLLSGAVGAIIYIAGSILISLLMIQTSADNLLVQPGFYGFLQTMDRYDWLKYIVDYAYYGLFIIFGFSIYFFMKDRKIHITARIGAIFLIAVSGISLISNSEIFNSLRYSSDPLFYNYFLIPNAIALIGRLAAMILLGIGLLMTPRFKALGITLLTFVVIWIGATAAIQFISNIIFTEFYNALIPISMLILSIRLFLYKEPDQISTETVSPAAAAE